MFITISEPPCERVNKSIDPIVRNNTRISKRPQATVTHAYSIVHVKHPFSGPSSHHV